MLNESREPRVAHRVVVALGGNAITSPHDEGTVEQDYANLKRSLDSIVKLVELGYQVVLTHGNGPQVGNQMIRVEQSKGQAPDLPLSVMVADIQGGLGYMIEQVLRNKLQARRLEVPICCLVTLVEVDADDPALHEPTKFVGPIMDQERALQRRADGWVVLEDRGRGYRRVVPSPDPKAIVEADSIRRLVEAGTVVINTGGGGVPVSRDASGELSGCEGVIDKDLASVVLGEQIGASELFILTAVEKVFLGFGTAEQQALDRINVRQARAYLAEGHFPPGSMGPKVEAACRFVENGGRRALITDIYTLTEAMEGKTGTWVVP
ncbi:MAG: carbamate kinase [Acidobacteriota bacterium]